MQRQEAQDGATAENIQEYEQDINRQESADTLKQVE